MCMFVLLVNLQAQSACTIVVVCLTSRTGRISRWRFCTHGTLWTCWAERQELGDDDCQSMILNNEFVGYEMKVHASMRFGTKVGFDVDMLGEVAPNHQQVRCLVRPRQHWIG